MAFWNDIQTDDCGHIWLLYPTYNILLEETGFVFRVMSPEGEYLGDTAETMLYDPTFITGDYDGWFYVRDAGNEDIVVFDPEGRFHTRFGREGSGPGDFQLVQFLCTEGDMIYIFDRPLMRTTRFRRSGELAVYDIRSIAEGLDYP